MTVSKTRTESNSTKFVDLKPDYKGAETFLNWLDEDKKHWTFQTFDDDRRRNDQALTKVFFGSFKQHREELARLNTRGAGIFLSINETKADGRKREHIR